ncbi:MAG: cysteine desulfuration protein SufE [Rhodospirillaceae bacterium]|nr:cysteine desulfuration protein SufE [Rhodospirillaceae bacterium]
MSVLINDPQLSLINPEISFPALVENFGFLEDWEDRYRYIIDLGKKLPEFPDSKRKDAYKVRGCMSQVWLVPSRLDGDNDRFAFAADSDAHIVKGLIYVLACLYCGVHIDDVSNINAEKSFAQLGLDQHLSPSRRNGVFSMIDSIRNEKT